LGFAYAISNPNEFVAEIFKFYTLGYFKENSFGEKIGKEILNYLNVLNRGKDLTKYKSKNFGEIKNIIEKTMPTLVSFFAKSSKK